MTESNCTCAVPCERVVYEPKLSYAQLSDLNVQRLVAGPTDQQDYLTTESQDEMNRLRVKCQHFHLRDSF